MLIIFAVLGHNHVTLACDMFINSFHMAAFFMISGFTFKVDEPARKFICKKCKKLLLPYFIFAVILLTYQYAKTFLFSGMEFDLKSGILSVFIPIGGRESTTVYGLWFLPCLFLAEMGAYIIIRLWEKTKTLGILAFGSILALGLEIHSQLSRSSIFGILPIATVFILLGYIFKEKQAFAKENYGLLFLASLLFFMTTFSNWKFGNVSTVDLSHMVLGIWQLYLLSSFFGSIAICELAMVVQKSRLLAFIGQDSLYYYGLHYEILGAVGKIVPGVLLRTVATFMILCPVIQVYKKYGVMRKRKTKDD